MLLNWLYVINAGLYRVYIPFLVDCVSTVSAAISNFMQKTKLLSWGEQLIPASGSLTVTVQLGSLFVVPTWHSHKHNMIYMPYYSHPYMMYICHRALLASIHDTYICQSYLSMPSTSIYANYGMDSFWVCVCTDRLHCSNLRSLCTGTAFSCATQIQGSMDYAL